MITLLFADRTTQGPCFHLTSVDWARNRLPGLHTHDYPEIFWITRGRCRHRVNEVDLELAEGEVVLMRARDLHALSPLDRAGFSFSNLSLNPGLFEGWRRRFAEDLDALYDEQTLLPFSRRLTRRALDELCEQARLLSRAPHTPLHLARFCCWIWAHLQEHAPLNAPAGTLPDWLREALIRIQEPECFTGGVPTFVSLCGRSHEHVARVCRQLLQKTPHALVTEARLERAANELRTSPLSITEIACNCGYAEPAPFYRLFKKRFGVTPRRYRWPSR